MYNKFKWNKNEKREWKINKNLGFWADIGQPKDYLTGVKLYMDFLQKKNDPTLTKSGPNIFGNVMIV